MDIQLFVGRFDMGFDVQGTVLLESGPFVEYDVKECDLCFTTFMCEFNGRVEGVDFVHAG